jgi:CDGSH-type Zn-finger protein
MDHTNDSFNLKKIEVCCDGPYIVTGNIPLVNTTQVVTEYGEPVAWKKDGRIPSGEAYFLCRCGHSSQKPYCDGTHLQIRFDGTETAPTNTNAKRQEVLPGGKNISIRNDMILCTSAGFCANRRTTIAEMAARTGDPQVRDLAIAMIQLCPSGALTYSLEGGGPEIEVDLAQQIFCTTEITSDGTIEGPLWVTGGIPVMRSDGKPFETRNRVTLCNCGHSQIKPLCDGSHREYPVRK